MRNILIYLLLMPLFVFSQNEKKYFEEAEKLYTSGDYYNALFNYKRASVGDSSDVAITYKMAQCYWKVNNHKLAEEYFVKVYKSVKDVGFPECSFWLAMSKKSNGKYTEAKQLFEKYYKKHKRQKSYFAYKSKQEIEACVFAQASILHPLPISIHSLDTSVNTIHSEFAPAVIDSSNLMFSSSKKDFVQLYFGKLNEVLLLDLLKTLAKNEVNTANLNLNDKLDKAYFTRCSTDETGTMTCAIYLSRLVNNKWSTPIALPEHINLPGCTNTQPHVATTDSMGEVLFFASDRKGGFGKLDLYFSKVDGDIYQQPVNLGKNVNSIDNEVTPYYCPPCKVLFFSSDWHKGMGGYDIFETSVQNGIWSEPQNAGAPINSSQNEVYFIKSKDLQRAYFSSNRIGSLYLKNETCCNDLYTFDLPEKFRKDSLDKVHSKEEMEANTRRDSIAQSIKMRKDSTKIWYAEMRMLMPLTLYFHNDEPNKKTLDTCTKLNYKKTYEDYIAMRKLYEEEYSKGLRGQGKEKAIRVIDEMFEDSVIQGFHNLERFAELLEKVLLAGEKVDVILKGYCSPLASTSYNVNLAKRRVCSTRNYFFEYKNGWFLSYTKSRQLNFGEEDVGEIKAKKETSDNYYDTRNSIYNPSAALERKIQIIDFKTNLGVFEVR